MAERLLPLVRHEIVDALLEDARDPEHAEKFLTHLRQENPEIAAFLASMAEAFPAPFNLLVVSSGATVYKMLESQAQADVMKKEFEVDA